MSFSRSQFPNGGWQFHQAQTGWSAPMPKASTFDQTVRQIIEHRRQNGAICIRYGLSMDPSKVADELENFTRLRCGIPMPQPVSPSVLLPAMSPSVVQTVADIKKLAFGAGLLMDWAESGEGAIPEDQARGRAAVCVNCPANQVGKLEEWRKAPLAVMLKSRIARLDTLSFPGKNDARLGLCENLFTPISYLMSEPEELIRKKMEKNPSVNTADCCWLKKGS